jgi:hypothetical protein
MRVLDDHVRDLVQQVVRDELARHAPTWEWATVDTTLESEIQIEP